MPWTNYHSHTNFSDGSDNPSEYIEEALKQGIHTYGFSCHAPVPFETDWCMKKENLERYFAEIGKLKEVYGSSIQILMGLEVDYVPGLVSPSDTLFRNSPLDYIIGSIHFVHSFRDGTPWGIDGSAELFRQGLEHIWNWDSKKAVMQYYKLLKEMVIHSNPKIIGHFDKIRMHNEGNRYFSEEEKWYKEEVFQALEVMHAAGCLMEVNTRGIYRGYTKEPYPSLWILKEAGKMGIPIVLNSDAHKPQESMAMFPETSVMLKEVGIKELYNWIKGKWQPTRFNESGIII
jgi:histidinol-phosphatase (PHP family)